jgi:hypothetical protein
MEVIMAEISQQTTRYKNPPFSPQFRSHPYLSLGIPSKYSTSISYSLLSFPISPNPPANKILGDPQVVALKACYYLNDDYQILGISALLLFRRLLNAKGRWRWSVMT